MAQFLAENWEETMPATVFGIEKYLGSGLIKGVGPKYAKKIVQEFGTDTLEIIETDVQRLLEVPGIGKKRVDKIAESWERQKEIKNVMLFLQNHGVSTAYAAKIYRQYGNESIEKVKENPFRLADDIWGIGFKTADSIADKLGIGKEAFIRLRSGIMYTLSELADEGHVYAERDKLIKKACELLEAEDTSITMTMDQMFIDKELIREKIRVPQFAEGDDIPEDAAPEIEKECIYLPPLPYLADTLDKGPKKLVSRDRVFHPFDKPQAGRYGVIVCDTATKARMIGLELYENAAAAMVIDHYVGNEGYGETNYTKISEACAENIFYMLDKHCLFQAQQEEHPTAADYIYLGILHDTGGFARAQVTTMQATAELLSIGVDHKELMVQLH